MFESWKIVPMYWTWTGNATTSEGEWAPTRECARSDTGKHEFVHVGFMQLKYACKHCDADAPEGWRPE